MCVCQAHIVHTLVCVSLVSLTVPEDEILTQIKVFLQMFFFGSERPAADVLSPTR